MNEKSGQRLINTADYTKKKTFISSGPKKTYTSKKENGRILRTWSKKT